MKQVELLKTLKAANEVFGYVRMSNDLGMNMKLVKRDVIEFVKNCNDPDHRFDVQCYCDMKGITVYFN